MTLKAFHILFIVLSILLAFAFGAWGMRAHSTQGESIYRNLGLVSFGVGAGLVLYGVWFLRKTKGIGRE